VNKRRGPFLILGLLTTAVFMILGFQNCSNDAGFIADPSVAQPFSNQTPPRIAGNENVVIQINQEPGNSTIDDPSSVVDFQVTSPAPGTTITDVTCTLDGVDIPCDATDTIVIDNTELGVGTHTFVIEGTNSDGETATETITFTIFNGITKITKDIDVSSNRDQADIIINIDNSGSMRSKQANMAARVSTFMDKFKNSDYRIMVITTMTGLEFLENKTNLDYAHGRALQYGDGSYCLTPAKSLAENQQLLGETVQRPETGEDSTGHERPMYTTRLMVERYLQAGSPESSCLRPGVAKHVIIISDEDETISWEDDGPDGIREGDPVENLQFSDANNLLSYMADKFPSSAFIAHSIIVNPYAEAAEIQACLNSRIGEQRGGVYIGTRLGALSLMTGGNIGNICASDYGSQLVDIGQIISDSSKIYPLGCIAVDNARESSTVTQGGLPFELTGYSFRGSNIVFDQNLAEGTYQLTYFCYQ